MTANRQLEIKEYFSREYFLWISFWDKLLNLTKNELTISSITLSKGIW